MLRVMCSDIGRLFRSRYDAAYEQLQSSRVNILSEFEPGCEDDLR